ncbi:CotD family spore coat protein [Lentibacillus sp. L22]|uniref:CotD family spore coat protein n=1 Tax=Lentibacillus TaxID=175304 RepID=UPI0022B10D56|nr:CotD family spore coat protein [Lentibacillus daqui]
MRHFGNNCGCPPRRVVHPTKCNRIDCCTENVIEHIHPSHTTVVNHHLERHRHVFPHSTSHENTMNCVDEFGGAFQTPPQGQCCGPGGMGPGMGKGNNGYGGNHHPHHHHHHHHKGMHHW